MQIGFYLDSLTNTFKACYEKCNKCTSGGNDANNNCQDCKAGFENINGNCKCPVCYNYEKTECIGSVPDGYYINSPSGRTIDKCPQKCGSCSLDSVNKDQCISCNTNY